MLVGVLSVALAGGALPPLAVGPHDWSDYLASLETAPGREPVPVLAVPAVPSLPAAVGGGDPGRPSTPPRPPRRWSSPTGCCRPGIGASRRPPRTTARSRTSGPRPAARH
nr:hypothetical protein GCM10020092_074960 [Actinoplanes digitatis]